MTPGDPSPNLRLASRVTVLALLVYLAALIVMWRNADTRNDATWARLTFLLTGIEAVVFTAVGWLFGREVNRARAEKAEQGEQEARGEADRAKQERAELASTGKALRRVLEPDPQSDRLGDRAPEPDLATLRAIARGFPEP
jgi:type VI protein secretion system component VasK